RFKPYKYDLVPYMGEQVLNFRNHKSVNGSVDLCSDSVKGRSRAHLLNAKARSPFVWVVHNFF
ncbi:MAG: hypothetical protein EA359_03510, partial [Balneolaceae bacterium]